MKKLVSQPVVVSLQDEVVTVDSVEFEDLLGKEVCVFSAIYIYAGKLVGVNDTHIVLSESGIVYQTGSFTDKNWKNFQKLPTKELKLRLNMIESYFEVVRQ